MANNKVLDCKCPSCNAILKYNPSSLNWKCEYCRNSYNLEDLKKFNSTNSDGNNYKENSEINELDIYRCNNCGAEIITDKYTSSTFCVYCGSTAILKNKLSGDFAPSKIIPFKKSKDIAIEKFKNLSKGRPLMPKSFNNSENIEKIKGIYIPFWLFDIDIEGKISVSATKIKTWTSGRYAYERTDVYDVFRNGNMKYNYIPVDGSTRFDNAIMNTLEPFDYSELVDYNHAYLSGFYAEIYDEDSEKVEVIAKNRAIASTREEIINDIGNYSTKVIKEESLNASSIDASYALLPVWMVNVKYNDKSYIFAMNGQTGEFIGDIPIDKKKEFRIAAMIFIISFVSIIIISLIFHLLTGGSL